MKFTLTVFILFVSVALWQCSTMPKTTVSGVGNQGRVMIDCDPSSAIVYVDGVKIGKASKFDSESDALVLESGSHLIEIRKKKYQAFRKEIYVGNRVLQTLQVKLHKS